MAASAVEDADVAVAAAAGEGRHNPAVRALGAMSEIADQAPSFIACGSLLAVGLATGRPKLAESGARMLASVVVAAVLKNGLKAVVSRTRPHAVLDGDAYDFRVNGAEGPEEHSFPSGHTAGAVAAARGLARACPAARLPAYGVAAAIGLIQLPRAKHYPADLAAGALVGLAAEAAVAVAATAIRRRRAVTSERARAGVPA